MHISLVLLATLKALLPPLSSHILNTMRSSAEMRAGPLGDPSSLASAFNSDWDNPGGGGSMTQEGRKKEVLVQGCPAICKEV